MPWGTEKDNPLTVIFVCLFQPSYYPKIYKYLNVIVIVNNDTNLDSIITLWKGPF